MQYFRPEVRVGVLLFCTLALFIAAALVVGKLNTLWVPKHEYTVLLPTANLLRNRAQVSYAGSPVGEVTAIRLRSEAARAREHPDYPVAVTVVLQGDIPLRTDARLELRTDGFIGERYVDISPGLGALVPPGGTVLGSLGGVEGLLASFSGVGGGLDELSQALRTLLADPAQPHSLPATLANVSRLIDTLLPRLVMLTTSADALLHGVRQDVAGLSTQAGGTLRRLDGTIDDTHDGLKRLLQELNTTMITARLAVLALQRFVETSQGSVVELLSSLRRTADSLQQSTEDLVGRAQKLLTHVDTVVLQNDRNLFTTVENLREVADNLKVASQLVRGNPAVLLWGTNNPNNASPANASSNGAPALQDRGRIGRYDRMP